MVFVSELCDRCPDLLYVEDPSTRRTSERGTPQLHSGLERRR